MAVGEEKNQDGGAARKWAIIPLRWWRFICAEASESLLCRMLVVGRSLQRRCAGRCRERGKWDVDAVLADGEAANVPQKIGKAPCSRWLCFERAMLLASWVARGTEALRVGGVDVIDRGYRYATVHNFKLGD